MKRKLLSLFLAMTLLLSCIPIPAFASEVEQNEAGAELQSVDLSTLDSIYDPVTNSVTVTNVPVGAIVTLGGYMNGQMVFVEMAEEHTGTVSWTLPDVKFDTLKVFGLNEDYAPICEAEEVELDTSDEFRIVSVTADPAQVSVGGTATWTTLQQAVWSPTGICLNCTVMVQRFSPEPIPPIIRSPIALQSPEVIM